MSGYKRPFTEVAVVRLLISVWSTPTIYTGGKALRGHLSYRHRLGLFNYAMQVP